jgi:hypothetical protein
MNVKKSLLQLIYHSRSDKCCAPTVLNCVAKQKKGERVTGKPAVFHNHIQYRPSLSTVTAKVHKFFFNI